MRALNRVVLVFVLALGLPAAAHAQASIAGTVKDTSGAVLPGVTVEASSPALMEKTRSVVTDDGQYRIVDLRPGTYTVSFTLQGFATVKREGIELTGSFTATVNAEMRVGGVAETVTVSGESPIVDVQSAVEQRVMQKEVDRRHPRRPQPSEPGDSDPRALDEHRHQRADAGRGRHQQPSPRQRVHHPRRPHERLEHQQDGFQVRNIGSFANLTNMFPDMGATQEMTIDYAAGLGEAATAGVKVNYVPREGGNTFRFSFFGTGVNSSFQGDNYSDDLQGRGLTHAQLAQARPTTSTARGAGRS